MRLALAYPGCHRRGGIERVVLECANFLAGRDHEVHLTTAKWDKEILSDEVIVHPVNVADRGALVQLLGFSQGSPRALASISPPVQVLGSFGVECPHGGVMWVPSVHKAWIEASSKQRDWKGRLRQKANPAHPVVLALEREYFAGRRYRRLIALSEQVKSDIVRLYSVPPDDIAILSNGYSPVEFNLDRAGSMRPQMRESLGYSNDDLVVIFVANELERKGFLPLVKAIAQLNDPRIKLLAVGRLDPTRYAGEIEQFGLTKSVQFTGPADDVAAYYSAADIFALPTQYEAWGLVIVEALACGVPVVTSRLAGAAIAVREGETGYLLDDPSNPEEIASKIKLVLDGKTVESHLIEQSVQHLTWQTVLKEYERHLQECAT